MRFKHSLKWRITLPTIGLFVAFTVVIAVTIQVISRVAIENFIYEDMDAKHQDMYQGMNMVLEEVNLHYSRIVLSDDFNTILQDLDGNNTIDQARIETMFLMAGINDTLIKEIVIIYNDNQIAWRQEQSNLTPPLSFKDTVLASTKLLEFSHTEIIETNSYMLFGKRMLNFPSADATGAIFFFLDEAIFRTFYEALDDSLGYTFVLQNSELIITHSEGKHLNAIIFDVDMFSFTTYPSHTIASINQERSIVIVSENNEFSNRYQLNWHIVSILSYQVLYQDILRLSQINIIIAIIMGMLALLLSFRIATKITSPINTMNRDLKEFTKAGKKRYNKDNASRDELWELEKTYEEMIEHIQYLIETNQTEAENKRKLELYTLQMQINPHFLYNTLDAIAWMAKLKQQEDIEKLVMALAKFFRTSLHKGEKMVKVTEEIDMIKHFIDIELIRFPDKFGVEYKVDPSIKDELILSLILQPVVENAIKHGISALDQRGDITIEVFPENDDIVFVVTDNGIGFSPTDYLFTNDKVDTLSGYGLKNVQDRIRLEYGEKYGINIKSKPNEGTKVTLTIAKIKRESDLV